MTLEEREYLKAVIKPFRNDIRYIAKYSYGKFSYISIQMNFNNEINIDKGIDSPFFETNTMYKDMETNKKYTLEELGL